MTAIEKAKRDAMRKLIQSIRGGDGWINPMEADDCLNNSSRRVIKAYADTYGSAWIGKTNRYSEDKGKPYLTEVKAQTLVYNFGADWVVPAYDQTLESLVIKYNEEGMKNAWANIDAVHQRVEELGGSLLMWS